MNRKQERDAWTAHIEGKPVKKAHKHLAVREGKYPSKHQAEVASGLKLLEREGRIFDLKEEVPFELIAGKNGVAGVTYVADFTYIENDMLVVADAKAWDRKKKKFITTQVFKIKKRMMFLLLGITVEEL